MRTRAALLAALASLLAAAPAGAADPGRWTLTGRSVIPIQYFQGVAPGPSGHLFFDGIAVGLYRTDAALTQEAKNDDVIPPAEAAKGFNHIGDISYDPHGGGRVLLPMECYVPGRGNTCGLGQIGVADPRTLQWRYGVPLDPRDIPKAMWNELSPNGKLLWTSSGNDLIAYRNRDISPAHSTGPEIRPVRRLVGAVPPSGITGATFYRGRLYLAGSQSTTFQVWSVDLRTGTRRLEIERTVSGESEGLATVERLGGVLNWMIQPIPIDGMPVTYKESSLLAFRPAHVRLGVRVRPRRVRAGHRARVVVKVTERLLYRARPVAGATVRIAGHSAVTGARGRAVLRFRPGAPGLLRVRARHGADTGRATLRVR